MCEEEPTTVSRMRVPSSSAGVLQISLEDPKTKNLHVYTDDTLLNRPVDIGGRPCGLRGSGS